MMMVIMMMMMMMIMIMIMIMMIMMMIMVIMMMMMMVMMMMMMMMMMVVVIMAMGKIAMTMAIIVTTNILRRFILNYIPSYHDIILMNINSFLPRSHQVQLQVLHLRPRLLHQAHPLLRQVPLPLPVPQQVTNDNKL